MNKRFTVVTLAALTAALAVTLSACGSPAQNTEISATTLSTTASTEATTQTSAEATADAAESPAEETANTLAFRELTDEQYGPAMPATDKAAMSDSALVAEVTTIMKKADGLNIALYGNIELGDSPELYDNTSIPDDTGAYYYIDNSIVANEAALKALYTDTFTESYLDRMETPLDIQLFGDSGSARDKNGELVYFPYYKTVDGRLVTFSSYMGVSPEYDYDTLVITSADESTVTASVAGTCLSFDSRTIYSVKLVKQNSGWLVDEVNIFDSAYWLGAELSKLISAENLALLGKIAGNAEYVLDESGNSVHRFIDDTAYLEIEPFMTIAEMETLIRSVFSDETAEYYSSQYVSRFAELDGKLYRQSYSNSAGFGGYDLPAARGCSYSGGANNSLNSVCIIPWSNGGESVNVYIELVNTADGLRVNNLLPSVSVGSAH